MLQKTNRMHIYYFFGPPDSINTINKSQSFEPNKLQLKQSDKKYCVSALSLNIEKGDLRKIYTFNMKNKI